MPLTQDEEHVQDGFNFLVKNLKTLDELIDKQPDGSPARAALIGCKVGAALVRIGLVKMVPAIALLEVQFESSDKEKTNDAETTTTPQTARGTKTTTEQDS